MLRLSLARGPGGTAHWTENDKSRFGVVAVLGALDAAGMRLRSSARWRPTSTAFPARRATPTSCCRSHTTPSTPGGVPPPDLSLERQGPFEGVTGTVRHLIALRGSPFVCELVALGDDPHDQERFRRRQRVEILGRTALNHWSTAHGTARLLDEIRFSIPP
jgi:hypothetical protein